MSDVMTKAEIEAQFVDKWILIEDPETDESLAVLRGRVRSREAFQFDILIGIPGIHPGRAARAKNPIGDLLNT